MIEIVATLEENINGIFTNPQLVKLYFDDNQVSVLLCAAQQKTHLTGLESPLEIVGEYHCSICGQNHPIFTPRK